MPVRDHSVWEAAWEVIRAHGLAVMLTFVLTYLRVLYDGKEPRPLRLFIEACIGSLLTLIIGLVVKEFGLSDGWAFAAAGFIGVLGVDTVRSLAMTWSKRKAEGQ